MPVTSEEAKRRELLPEHELLREIRGEQGCVSIEVAYEPRPDYARQTARLIDRGRLGTWIESNREAAILCSDVTMGVNAARMRAEGTAEVRAGQILHVSVSYSRNGPAVVPPLGPMARRRMDGTVAWWRAWSQRCSYAGPYRDAVMRSLLVLKLLSYAPSGAFIAAPTTSLPEVTGGVRNWDYRYCWLRDASFTMRALLGLGYEEEAAAFCSWLLDTTRLSWPKLRVLYDVYGGTRHRQQQLSHLRGFAGSRPVRIGNDAQCQLQLDVYGELLDAVSHFLLERGHSLDGDTRRMLAGLGRTVCDDWQSADEGIWEMPNGRFQHTYSKVMCWVALDRLLELNEAGKLQVPVAKLQAARDSIRSCVEGRGFSSELGSYTRTLDGSDVDASLLLLPLYGYVEPKSRRMRSTVEQVLRRLGCGPFVLRYEAGLDGLPGSEGGFGIASFWAVQALARAGRLSKAVSLFEQLLGYANDVGLYAEQFDPDNGEPLGNYPQAFTHVGLINAALVLEELQAGRQEAARVTSEART